MNNYINKFIVPKVEALVGKDFVNNLEEQIREMRPFVFSQSYSFWTTSVNPPMWALLNLGARTNAIPGSDRQNVYNSISNSERQIRANKSKIKDLAGTPASDFVEKAFRWRRIPVVTTTFTGGSYVGLNQVQARQEPLSTSFRQGDDEKPLNKAWKLTLPASNVTGSSPPDISLSGSPFEATGIFTADPTVPGAGATYFKEGDIVGISLDADKQEIFKKILNRERNNYSKTYTPKELARIFAVHLAIKILARYQEEVGNQAIKLGGDEAQEILNNPEKILETVRKEILQNPDSGGLSDAQKENIAQQIKKGIKIRPQCILINNVLELAKLNRKRLNAAYSDDQKDDVINYQFTRMVSNPENPAATINKLTRLPGQEEIMNLRPQHFARMFPYLRLYKVLTFTDKETKSQIISEVEFKFPNATNVQKTNPSMDIFENLQNPLTQEYGIKSFDWRFIGSDPFTYSNDIEATLVIHFNDFEQLVVERDQGLFPNTKKYKILDLVTISEKEREAIKNKDPDAKFDIRADVGWSGPSDPSELKSFDSDLNKKGFDVDNSIRTLFLTMTDYDISFNEEGHFEMTINYKSRLEQSLYDKKTNILIPDSASRSQIESKEAELEDLRRSSDEQNIDVIREIESELQQLRLQTKQDTYGNLFRFLIENNSLYTEPLKKDEFFTTTGITSFGATLTNKDDQEQIFTQLNKEIDSLREQQKNEEASAQDPTKKVVEFPVKKENGHYLLNYFFLGDLVEALSQKCLSKNNKRLPSEQKFLDDTRIVLTDFLLYDPQDLNK